MNEWISRRLFKLFKLSKSHPNLHRSLNSPGPVRTASPGSPFRPNELFRRQTDDMKTTTTDACPKLISARRSIRPTARAKNDASQTVRETSTATAMGDFGTNLSVCLLGIGLIGSAIKFETAFLPQPSEICKNQAHKYTEPPLRHHGTSDQSIIFLSDTTSSSSSLL